MKELYIVSEAICYAPCDAAIDLGSYAELYATYEAAEKRVVALMCEMVSDRYNDRDDITKEFCANCVKEIYARKHEHFDEWHWTDDNETAYCWSITKTEVKE